MTLNPNNISKRFRDHFGTSPILVESPARVNLIGEHTDYNNGFVLPAAIDKVIVLALAPNKRNKIRLFAADMDQPEFEIEMADLFKNSGMGWPDYILGVVDQLQKRGYHVGGFDCLFGGNIPIGAGLSSSAALEGGILTGLSALFDLNLTKLQMAKIGQKAENRFVGVQCGIMDQFANLHGKSGSVIRLDCRSLEYSLYPFEQEDIAILLCDTKVRRELATSEYNVRREQCEEGVRILKEFDPAIKSLRDIKDDFLEHRRDTLPKVIYNRCRYVLDENKRVLDACENLLMGDIESFGKKMYGSHYGLRDLYEVSCKELDVLVDATENIDAVLGSRMMGGGFGGCTINLVYEQEIESVTEQINRHYQAELNKPIEFYVAKIGKGASVLEIAG